MQTVTETGKQLSRGKCATRKRTGRAMARKSNKQHKQAVTKKVLAGILHGVCMGYSAHLYGVSNCTRCSGQITDIMDNREPMQYDGGLSNGIEYRWDYVHEKWELYGYAYKRE